MSGRSTTAASMSQTTARAPGSLMKSRPWLSNLGSRSAHGENEPPEQKCSPSSRDRAPPEHHSLDAWTVFEWGDNDSRPAALAGVRNRSSGRCVWMGSDTDLGRPPATGRTRVPVVSGPHQTVCGGSRYHGESRRGRGRFISRPSARLSKRRPDRGPIPFPTVYGTRRPWPGMAQPVARREDGSARVSARVCART